MPPAALTLSSHIFQTTCCFLASSASGASQREWRSDLDVGGPCGRRPIVRCRNARGDDRCAGTSGGVEFIDSLQFGWFREVCAGPTGGGLQSPYPSPPASATHMVTAGAVMMTKVWAAVRRNMTVNGAEPLLECAVSDATAVKVAFASHSKHRRDRDVEDLEQGRSRCTPSAKGG